MKEYEMIHEIINQCPLNHSRDQFLEEITCESPEEYLKAKFGQEKELQCEKTILKNGSIVFEVYASGLHHRFTFSEF